MLIPSHTLQISPAQLLAAAEDLLPGCATVEDVKAGAVLLGVIMSAYYDLAFHLSTPPADMAPVPPRGRDRIDTAYMFVNGPQFDLFCRALGQPPHEVRAELAAQLRLKTAGRDCCLVLPEPHRRAMQKLMRRPVREDSNV